MQSGKKFKFSFRFLILKIVFFSIVTLFVSVGQTLTTTPPMYSPEPLPIVIAHRGASGYRPEHTIEAYQLALEMKSDFIDIDLISTKDGALIARHENEISTTTDVAQKFPKRKTTKIIEGKTVKGWFAEDFTLAEIKTLRAKERLPFRSHEYDGKFVIPTFEEILLYFKDKSIGFYPELKHPLYFDSIGLPLEEKVVTLLKKFNLDKKDSSVFIQSFNLESLKKIKSTSETKLVYLIEYAENLNLNFNELSKFVVGIGPHKRLILPTDANGSLSAPTSMIEDAHKAGLLVHPFTFRNEDIFLAPDYKGDPLCEYLQFRKLGVDGYFTDFPDFAKSSLNP